MPISPRGSQAIPSSDVSSFQMPSAPYGGTGFVVGRPADDQPACSGNLPGTAKSPVHADAAAIDFKRERDRPDSVLVQVEKVVMIHPYWDMALLRVSALPAAQKPLLLSLSDPGDLDGEVVAVIGYPAFDPRNPAEVQNTVFGGVYYVKRLQPAIAAACQHESFERSRPPHDSSTLGQPRVCSRQRQDRRGGACISAGVSAGELRGPASDLAVDGRVIDAGVNFAPGAAAANQATSGGKKVEAA
jgi:endonuclease G